jgi:hypothetical protein
MGVAAAAGRWRRPSSWIATGLLAASLAMVAFALVSLTIPGNSALPNRPTPAMFLAACSIFVALPSVGALLAIRRPHNPIGWLFLVCGAGFTIGIFSVEYVGWSIAFGLDLPGVVFVDWLGSWAGLLSIAVAVTWIPLVFPDGHLPSHRWRAVAWAAAALVIVVLAGAIIPYPADGYPGQLPNPFGVSGAIGEVATLVVGLSFQAMAIVGLLALVSLVVRFRRSRDVERQQLKWFLFAVGFLVIAVIAAIITQLEGAWAVVMLGLASLPVAVGIAVLRYRLFEIDRIISRTIGWALVTGAVLSDFTQGETLAVAASTLVAFALFQPLRRRVQTAVDRRFDRARYDGERTAAAFGDRLRDQVDIDAVASDLRATVDAGIRPATIGLWLRAVGETRR